MTVKTDMPCILVPLLENRPWERKNAKGEVEHYEDNVWKVKDISRVGKIEAQIWITIFTMFLGQDAQRKYEINNFRK